MSWRAPSGEPAGRACDGNGVGLFWSLGLDLYNERNPFIVQE